MGKSKFIKEQIKSIHQLAEQEIPALINKGCTDEEYAKLRVSLNLHCIQCMIGAEVVEPKKNGKEFKLKFSHKLPNKSEIAEVVGIIDKFIADVENPYFVALNQAAQAAAAAAAGTQPGAASGMGIPNRNVVAMTTSQNVCSIEKANAKKLTNYVFGYDGKSAFSRMALTGMDCLTLAGIGEEVRKRTNRKRMIIVGGVALVVTGGVVTGVLIHKHNKKDQEDLEKLCEDEVDLDGGVIGETEVDLDDDDAPVVPID